VAGNVSADGRDLNGKGNEPSPFPAPPVDTQDACTAATLVLANAGVRPLDGVDQQYLSGITAAPCGGGPLPATLSVSPESLTFVTIVGHPAVPKTVTIANAGEGALSWDASTGGEPWLSVGPTSDTAPSVLTVTADASGLLEGLYPGTVTVEARTPAKSSRLIPVTLVIGPPGPGSETSQTRIASAADDGMESLSGSVKTSETELPVGRGSLVAFRFINVTTPRGAAIESAVLLMYGVRDLERNIVIRYQGEAVEDSAPLRRRLYDLSSRLRTEAFVNDAPGPWAKGAFNASADLSSVLQEIVNQPDWAPGNSLTLFVEDDGSSRRRRIGAFGIDGSHAKATILAVTYRLP